MFQDDTLFFAESEQASGEPQRFAAKMGSQIVILFCSLSIHFL